MYIYRLATWRRTSASKRNASALVGKVVGAPLVGGEQLWWVGGWVSVTHADTDTDTYTDRRTHTHTHRHRHTQAQTDRQIDRQTDTHIGKVVGAPVVGGEHPSE